MPGCEIHVHVCAVRGGVTSSVREGCVECGIWHVA